MRGNDGIFNYPVPWASGEDTNFIETQATYRSLLSAEGFEVIKERDHSDFALIFFKALQARPGGPAKFGLQIVMGPTSPQKAANMIGLVERGTVKPVVIICHRVEASPHAGNV